MATHKRKLASVQPHEVTRKPEEEKNRFKYNSVSSMNPEQKHLIQQLYQNDVVVVKGIAGSGKTFCTMGVAAEFLKRDLVEQIIISRPVVAAERMGYLKGGIRDKIGPFTEPILNELDKFIDVKKYTSEKRILVLPIAFMRAWNFRDSFVVIDESQNISYRLFKLIITRLCENSKMVFCGDVAQSDLNNDSSEDFARFVEVAEKLAEDPDNKVAVVELLNSVRHPLVEKFLSVM